MVHIPHIPLARLDTEGVSLDTSDTPIDETPVLADAIQSVASEIRDAITNDPSMTNVELNTMIMSTMKEHSASLSINPATLDILSDPHVAEGMTQFLALMQTIPPSSQPAVHVVSAVSGVSEAELDLILEEETFNPIEAACEEYETSYEDFKETINTTGTENAKSAFGDMLGNVMLAMGIDNPELVEKGKSIFEIGSQKLAQQMLLNVMMPQTILPMSILPVPHTLPPRRLGPPRRRLDSDSDDCEDNHEDNHEDS